MAISSKPVYRLTSPRWHTTFRGDDQPKCYVIINMRNSHDVRNVNVVKECVLI